MKLYFYPNRFNKEQTETAAACMRVFTDKGIACSVPEDLAPSIAGLVPLSDFCAEEADAVVSVGGDGSVLRAAQVAVKAAKPLFGINDGHVGFLCRYSLEEAASLSEEDILLLNYTKRTLLSFDLGDGEQFALNDIVIAKRDFSTAMRLSAAVDGIPAGKWHGDGIIVSTPTGSTAYNRSAGGPKLMPGSRCFVMTPVCSYTAPNQSVVFADSSVLRIKVEEGMMRPSLYADGVSFGEPGREIEIRRYARDLMLATRD